ncbi:hypothetical protein PoB_006229200 [Plakobranchus ocellatus]|uniref:Plethodontid modulating factor n=1 Tax=Plakobranchus ocellatus TaxID=259542 RepID=A0AAV4CV51_9GAST|nr:hypothetical protein PoB_006229200 [Plakobranchus ocellatus]
MRAFSVLFALLAFAAIAQMVFMQEEDGPDRCRQEDLCDEEEDIVRTWAVDQVKYCCPKDQRLNFSPVGPSNFTDYICECLD